MAWAFVQALGSNSANTSASVAVTLGVTPTLNNFIVVWMGWVSNTKVLSTPTDSKGNTYTVIHFKNLSGKCAAVAIAKNTAGLVSGDAITMAVTGGTTSLMVAASEFSGGSTSKDTDIDANGASGTDAAITWSIANGNELAFAAIASVTLVAGDVSAPPTGWSGAYDFACTGGTNLCLRGDYAIGLASGARTDTWTGTIKNAWNVSAGVMLLTAPGALPPGGQMPCFGAQ